MLSTREHHFSDRKSSIAPGPGEHKNAVLADLATGPTRWRTYKPGRSCAPSLCRSGRVPWLRSGPQYLLPRLIN